MMCPAETPEGEAVGLIKNLALMASVSIGLPDRSVVEKILEQDLGLVNLNLADQPGVLPDVSSAAVKVFVNGDWIGVHRDPEQLVARFRQLRRTTPAILGQVSIAWFQQHREIWIRTDAGRLIRPLLVVAAGDNELLLDERHIRRIQDPNDPYGWRDLLEAGVVEYLDVLEEETARIAMFPDDLKRQRQQQQQQRQVLQRLIPIHSDS